MKIVSINTLDTRGGGSKLAYDLQNKLISRGNQASLYVGKRYSTDPNVFSVEKQSWIFRTIKRLTGKDIPRRIRKIINSVFPTDIDFFNVRGLFGSIQYKEADIVHCHNLHGNYFKLSSLIKIAREKPIIWTLHDMWAITHRCAHSFDGKLTCGFYECPRIPVYPESLWRNEKYLRNKKGDIYEKIREVSPTHQMHIVVPAKWLKEKVEKSALYSGKNGMHNQVHLIHNGIDPTKYAPSSKIEARLKLGLPESAKIITFVAYKGSENPWKGWNYAEKVMEYFKHDPNVLFLCLGEEVEKKPEKVSEGAKKNVTYKKYIDDEKTMISYYNASDILLFTSIAETFPLIIPEAMACGLPIVSFDVGGVSDALIHKENGYLAKYCDVNDAIEGIKYIFGLSKEDLETMKTKSRKRVLENFTLDQMVDKYVTLYQQAIKIYDQQN